MRGNVLLKILLAAAFSILLFMISGCGKTTDTNTGNTNTTTTDTLVWDQGKWDQAKWQ